MANRHNTLTDLFTDVADAIREKTGSADEIKADDFDTAIAAIPSGSGIPDSAFVSTGDLVPQFTDSDLYKYIFEHEDLRQKLDFRVCSGFTDCMYYDTIFERIDLTNIRCDNVEEEGFYESFYYCENIKYINLSILPAGMTIPVEKSFSNNNNLETLILGDFVLDGTFAVNNNYKLKELVIKNSDEKVRVISNSFNKCYWLLGTTHSTYNPQGLKGKVYVPDALVSTYQADTYWGQCDIQPLSSWVPH